MSALKTEKFVGRPVEELTLQERWKLAGTWIALELYSPERLPLRVIEAIGKDAPECMQQLRHRGLDPAQYEYEPIPQPYSH